MPGKAPWPDQPMSMGFGRRFFADKKLKRAISLYIICYKNHFDQNTVEPKAKDSFLVIPPVHSSSKSLRKRVSGSSKSQGEIPRYVRRDYSFLYSYVSKMLNVCQ